MRKLLSGSAMTLVFGLFAEMALAAPVQDVQSIFVKWSAYLFLLFAIVVAALVYFLRPREDRRASRIDNILQARTAVRAVGPEAPVADCVRIMVAENIGALLVMENDQLIGIFTERDALKRVLAAGLDSARTKVSEVMTRDPYCVAPTITVGAAMDLVTRRRFRHLPIMEDGRLRGMISSGDLTHWLVTDGMGETEPYVPLAARSP